jgi:CDP-diacylglycerol--glycerol-3-phosphate 3-phosphatidyltransferase
MPGWSRATAIVPNLLSSFRIVCSPVLLALAWNGETALFLVLFGIGLVSDLLDGVLARWLGLESNFGAQLDQWGDFALWVSFVVGAMWLWPEVVRREAPYAALGIACLLLPTAVAYAKYRSVPGYHTWLAKLTSVLMGITVPLLLIFDFAWPFRIAVFSLVLSAADEIAITWLLPECRHDVASVLHALRGRPRSPCEGSRPGQRGSPLL